MKKIDREARAKQINVDILNSILLRLDRLEFVLSRYNSVWLADSERVQQYVANWRTSTKVKP